MQVKSFPSLYAKSSTGKVKFWQVSAEEVEGQGRIIVRHGYVGQKEDKIQTSIKKVEAGKNLGRSNETTPFEQACSEAQSAWNKKRDKLYVEDPAGTATARLPMLAQDYADRAHDIVWPAYVQPKLEGCRALAYKSAPGVITFYTRGGKTFNVLQHLVAHLDRVMDVGAWLDGEIFVRGHTFQEISSAIKKQGPLTASLQYWVYDCIVEGASYKERLAILSRCLGTDGPVRRLETHIVASEAEMKALHNQFVLAGYEGTIIRNEAGLYKCDFRSADLQKYKDWKTQEFVIVGGHEGRGKDEGTIIWECITEKGNTFTVRPKGPVAQRKYWFEHRAEFFGKKLTVEFQRFTDEGKPYLPRGIDLDRESYE